MDVSGLLIGLPGLLQSCVHGYRFVCEMIELDENVAILKLRYRIEESRLTLWGRYWGLLTTEDESSKKMATQSIEELLEIPGVGTLINDILSKIEDLLKQSAKMSDAYGVNQASDQGQTTQAPSEKSKLPWQRRHGKHKATARIRWALKDKSTFQAVLDSLVALNDGLEKVLPRQQRAKLGQALVGEVLSQEGMTSDQSGALVIALDRTRLEVEGPLPQAKSDVARVESDYQNRTSSSGFSECEDSLDPEKDFEDVEEEEESDAGREEEDMTKSMQLPLEWFIGLEAKTDGFSMEIMVNPGGSKPIIDATTTTDNRKTNNENGAHQPTENERSDLEPTAAMDKQVIMDPPEQSESSSGETVFVEWRSYERTIANEELQMALNARREHLSRLFRRESKDSSQFVMQCLGFVLCSNTTMGLVFRPPSWSSGAPLSLNHILRKNFQSMDAIAPDLEDRIQLAKKLSTALYQLQCAGWLHRKISSHNVMFFASKTSNAESRTATDVDMSHLLLTGWQTARFDDQLQFDHSEGYYMTRKNPFQENELLYVHPARPNAGIRFKRSFDVYSLGIVLAEIAFWEPVDVLNGENQEGLFPADDGPLFGQPIKPDLNKLRKRSEAILQTCKDELAGEVGGHYRSAVTWCLEGTKIWHAQQASARPSASKEELDREVGLEKAFFWNVLNQLDFVTSF